MVNLHANESTGGNEPGGFVVSAKPPQENINVRSPTLYRMAPPRFLSSRFNAEAT